MRIDYAVSLWNYSHYANAPSLERVLAMLRAHGYGVELWGRWRDEVDLYDETGRRRVKNALDGMPVSLHTALVDTLAGHRKQVDAAVDLGAQVLVLHPSDLYVAHTRDLDVALARQVVDYAGARGIKLALENGQLPFLANAFAEVPGLYACLDVGHVYLTPDPMAKFMEVMHGRLIHLHLQDLAVPPLVDQRFPGTGVDHYTPGAGGIPQQDWALLIRTLREIEFTGTAVFEIQPPNPVQTAHVGREFLASLGLRSD